jgi:hypothetical protein
MSSVLPAELRLNAGTALVLDAPRLRRHDESLVLTGRVLVPIAVETVTAADTAVRQDGSLMAVVFDSNGVTRRVGSPEGALVTQQSALVRLHDNGSLSALWLPFLEDDPRRTVALLGGFWNGRVWAQIDSVVRPRHSNRLEFPELIDARMSNDIDIVAVVRWFEAGRSSDALVRTNKRGLVVSSAALPFSPRLAVVARDSIQLVAVGIRPSPLGGATVAVWTSSDGGKSWGNPTPIEAATVANVQPPSLVNVGGDTLIAAWAASPAESTGSVQEIHAAVSEDGGVTWRSVQPFRLDHEIWGIDLTSDRRGRVAVAVSTAAFEGTMALRPEVLALNWEAAKWRRVWTAPSEAPAMGVATLASDVRNDLVVIYAPTPGDGNMLRPAVAAVLPSGCAFRTP